MRGLGEGGLHVAVAPQDLGRRRPAERRRRRGKAGARLPGRRAFVPGHLQLVARPVRQPPVRRDNRDAVDEPLRLRAALDGERVMHAAQCLDRVDIGGDEPAAEHRAFLEHGIEHAGTRHIDAEKRLALDDARVVDAALRMPDDLEILRVLQLHGGEVGDRHAGRVGGERAVAERAAARAVAHDTGSGLACRRRHLPLRGGRGDQHLPRRGADPAQRLPVQRRRHAAAGELPAVFGRVERCLLDPDPRPVGIELLGDQHRQHRLDALADLRVLREDRHAAVRHDPDKGVEDPQLRRRGAGKCGARRRRQRGVQQEAAAGEGSRPQEGAARRAARQRRHRRRRRVAVPGEHRQRLRAVGAGIAAACWIALRIRR